MAFIDSSAAFIKEDDEKKKNLEIIRQAIATTNETIKIFKHIHEVMENENKRRANLIRKLE